MFNGVTCAKRLKQHLSEKQACVNFPRSFSRLEGDISWHANCSLGQLARHNFFPSPDERHRKLELHIGYLPTQYSLVDSILGQDIVTTLSRHEKSFNLSSITGQSESCGFNT